MSDQQLQEQQEGGGRAPQLVLFGHPGTEVKSFPKFPTVQNADEESHCFGGRKDVHEMTCGQRYYIQTNALVKNNNNNPNDKEAVMVEPKLVRFWAEYEGNAQLIATMPPKLSSATTTKWDPPLANSLNDTPTRVMRPLLHGNPTTSSNKPPNTSLESFIFNNDPCVFTAGAFRYTMCKQSANNGKYLRDLPSGSIVLFCSMNNQQCYLDTVFVVDEHVDVVKPSVWNNQIKMQIMNNKGRDEKGRLKNTRDSKQKQQQWDYCCLTNENYSKYMGSQAWNKVLAFDEDHNNKDSCLLSKKRCLIDDATRNKLRSLRDEFNERNNQNKNHNSIDVSWLAKAVKTGKQNVQYFPLSTKLYYGREFQQRGDKGGGAGQPHSFVPVVVVPEGEEHSTDIHLMRIRPQLNLNRIYKIVGKGKAPNPNAQMISSAALITAEAQAHENADMAVFQEIVSQVKSQGFDIGVTVAPPFAEPLTNPITNHNKKQKTLHHFFKKP